MSRSLLIMVLAVMLLAGGGMIVLFWTGEDSARDEGKGSRSTPDAAGRDKAQEAPSSTAGGGEGGEDRAAEGTADSQERVRSGKESTFTLLGRVLDATGQPIEGVALQEAYGERFSRWRDPPEDAAFKDTGIRTGPAGGFTIEIARDKIPLAFLRFVHPDYRSATTDLVSAVPAFDGSLLLDDLVLDEAFFISGLVLNGKGEPVSGCAVSAPGKPWEYRNQDWWEVVETDEQGRFLLPMRDNRPVCVTAHLEDYGTGWSGKVNPGSGDAIPDIRITLSRGGAIGGRILYADGSPAAGQRIKLEAEIGDFKVRRSTDADQEGRFRIHPLPNGAYRVSVARLGMPGNVGRYNDLVLAEKVVPGDEDLELYLPPGSRIVLELVDVSGEPVLEEPEVDIYQIVKYDPDRSGTTHVGLGWSGKVEDLGPGIFGYRGFNPGTFYMSLKVIGYSYHRNEEIEVPHPPGEVRVRVVLMPTRSIAGRVNRADGDPAWGVGVLWERTSDYNPWKSDQPRAAFTNRMVRARNHGRFGTLTVTDDNGSFRFDNLAEGTYHLFFSVDGKEIWRESPVLISDEEPRAELSVTLPDVAGTIEGVVRDGTGSPLAEALVVAWDGDVFLYRTRSDGEGNFRLSGLPDGRYVVDSRALSSWGFPTNSGFTTTFIREGYEDLEGLNAFNAVIQDGSTCTLNLLIADPWNGVVSGRVASGASSLPADLRIYLREYHEEPVDYRLQRPKASDLFDFQGARDADPRLDRFRFMNRRAGTYQLRADWGKDRYAVESEPFDLPPSHRHEMTFRLALAALEGRVVNRTTGAAVAGARVVLEELVKAGGRREYAMETDESGAFARQHIPSGTFNLIILHDDHAPYLEPAFRMDESVDRTGLRFELDPGYTVSGRLSRPGGFTGERYAYDLRIGFPSLEEHWPGWVEPISKDGSFTLKGLPPGLVKLTVRHRSKTVAEQKVQLPMPEGEELVIALD